MDNIKDKDIEKFINKTFPELITQISRFNDSVERALDYYAIETFGKIPKRDIKK